MSAADQAKGPSEAGLRTAAYIFERLDFSPTGEGEIKLVANKVDEAAQPLAAALRELLEAAEGEFASPDVAKALKAIKRMASANVQARDALRGWDQGGEQ